MIITTKSENVKKHKKQENLLDPRGENDASARHLNVSTRPPSRRRRVHKP